MNLNIKQIVDRITSEGDLNRAHYTVADRLIDVNTEQRKLIEIANQYGSKYRISNAEENQETFTIVDGDNEFTRDIPNVNIVKWEWTNLATPEERDWQELTEGDHEKLEWYIRGMRVTADEKKIKVKDAYAGKIRVTYERGLITDFDLGDYDTSEPTEITWIDRLYQPLLYLGPMLPKLAKFKKGNFYTAQKKVYDDLLELFINKYSRNAVISDQLDIEDDNEL